MLEDRLVTHGLSPAVYSQNELIGQLMVVGAQQSPPDILGVQLLGSRAHGSAMLRSDIDVAIITARGKVQEGRDLRERLRIVLLPFTGAMVDLGDAALVQGIRSTVPYNPTEFVRWVRRRPLNTIALYESGIYDTLNLRFAASAAAEVIKTVDDPEGTWRLIRRRHAAVYLGSADRFYDKLSERTPYDRKTIEQTFNEDFWQERLDKLGLSEDLDEYHTHLEGWVQGYPEDGGEKGLRLYEGVARVLKGRK